MLSARSSRWLLGLWCVALLLWRGLGDDGGLLQALSDLRYRGLGAAGLASFAADLIALALPAVLLGTLCGAATWRPRTDGWGRYLRDRTVGALLALVLGWLYAGLTAPEQPPSLPGWHLSGLIEAFWPSGLALFGALLFGPLPRFSGRLALRGLLIRLVGLALLTAATALLARALLFQPAPLDLPTTPVESWQKRELVDLARAHNPFRLAADERTTLSLRPDQLATLLAWGATVFDADARAAADASGEHASFALSLGRGQHHLNLRLLVQAHWYGATAPEIADCSMTIGRLEVTGASCGWLLRTAYAAVVGYPAIASALESLQEASLDGRGLRANYGPLALTGDAKGALRRLLAPAPAVRAAVAAQVDALRAAAATLPRGDAGFAETLRGAFTLARERSDDSDPLSENQGALLALGGVLGHHDVFAIAGLERPTDLDDLRDAYQRATLRGRDDHTKHFLVSAALTQVSNTLVADAAGLLKEEIDAGGNSGFSFADLQADRAGTLFGETAVKSAAHARALQTLVADEFDVDAISPDTAGMPEGLTDAAISARFGGIGGAGYTALTDEIERRLRGARAYRDLPVEP